MHIANKSMFILYVRDQQRSAEFYERVLNIKPSLNVPSMTEFELTDSGTLGLMPESGIKRLLGDPLPDPAAANGTPRAELYLLVETANEFHHRALAAGAKELSKLTLRSWGDKAAYSLDPDGHVLAFAEKAAS